MKVVRSYSYLEVGEPFNITYDRRLTYHILDFGRHVQAVKDASPYWPPVRDVQNTGALSRVAASRLMIAVGVWVWRRG